MELTINKLRIELSNLISGYREKNVPIYIITGILAEELLKMKERELAEFVVTMNNELMDTRKKLEVQDNGKSIPESN